MFYKMMAIMFTLVITLMVVDANTTSTREATVVATSIENVE